MQNQRTVTDKKFDKSIAWITPILGRYGKLMYMEPLLSQLAYNCKRLTIITSVFPANTENYPFRILVGSRLLGIYWKGKSSYLKGFAFIAPSFYKKIKHANADILFLIEFSLTSVYGLIFSAINKNTKTVLLVESKPIENNGRILNTLKNSFRKAIAKRCDVILTNNKAGKDYLINQLKTEPDKIITRPYLISQTSNSTIINYKRFLNLDINSRINFLFVGQIIERKGLQFLIEAVNLIPEDSRKRIHIDIVGEGDYLDSLSKQISDYNLGSNFSFRGRVEYSELFDFYASAHVFIFPTLSDYRALSPFEALGAGLPIISSIHDGGSSENAIEGANGHVCDPLDTSAFSKIITGILDNPENLYQYSLKSLEMSKEYTLDKAVDNMLSAASLAISKKH